MTKQKLTEICGFKIQAHRKAYLDGKTYECRYSCNGHNKECDDYTPVEVLLTHYLITTNGNLEENKLK